MTLDALAQRIACSLCSLTAWMVRQLPYGYWAGCVRQFLIALDDSTEEYAEILEIVRLAIVQRHIGGKWYG